MMVFSKISEEAKVAITGDGGDDKVTIDIDIITIGIKFLNF